jgi:hypothetical protein
MKKKLLFIAPTVPLFDQNSGDLRLFTILSMLSNSYDITYLAHNAVSNVSVENYHVSRLTDLGINVYVKDFSIVNILRSNRFHAAIIEFYRIAEYYTPRIKILQQLSSGCRRYGGCSLFATSSNIVITPFKIFNEEPKQGIVDIPQQIWY